MDPSNKSLEQIWKDDRVDWYRCPIERSKLVELMQPNDLQGWLQTGGHLVLFAITGSTTCYLFAHEFWFGFALALFIHGTVASFFKGIAAHELGHGTVFKSKWFNQLFLRIFSIISWHNFHEYAMSHTYHHKYTLHPKGDREVVLPMVPSLKPLYLLQLFSFNLFGGPVTSGAIPIIRGTIETAFGKFGSAVNSEEWNRALYESYPLERKKAVNWARCILLFHLGLLTIAIAFQFWVLVLVLTLQQFTANALKYFVGLPMHCGLRSHVSDFRKCVRTITLDPVSEFLYWRMNWHLEHHMYAGVPCYNLKKLHREVATDMPAPRTLTGAWREMRDTWRRQETNPDYGYDTPVPTPAVKDATGDDALAKSFGDLSPEVLAP